jgi:Mn2+/Fe2+ NRAMP family transporter
MTPKKHSARWLAYLAVLGPGVLAASAGNDAGGIATYAQAGAAYRYDLLWLLFIITFSLVVVQEMSARMGAVTGKGLSDLIRENFGVRWAVLAMLALVTANFFVTVANLAGVAAALQLFGISPFISVPAAVIGLLLLLTRGSYFIVERGLLLLAALFLAYPIAAFTVGARWGTVFHDMLVPSVDWVGGFNPGFLALSIGIIGTTIAPWMTFFLQASIVDKGVRKQDLPLRRFDVVIGAVSANVIAFFIIVTTAVLYHGFGAYEFQDAGDAAQALSSLVRGAAPYLFGAGLFGASVLGTAAVPLTTAYAVTEAFGWERGLDHRIGQAPIFFGLLAGILGLGAVVVLATPTHMLFPLILFSQVINGMLIPVILVFMLLLINNQRLMGEYTNSRIFNLIAWGTIGIVTLMTFTWFGIMMLGGG